MKKLLFDTNIFNKILDGKIDESKFQNFSCFATHIQLDEIRATRNEQRRIKLESIFNSIIAHQIPTDSLILGVSRIGMSKISNGDLFHKLILRLDSLNNSKLNNIQDVLIAETAIKNNFTLITEDRHLTQVVTEFGGIACDLLQIL